MRLEMHLHLIKAALTPSQMLWLLISLMFLLFATASVSLCNHRSDLFICAFPRSPFNVFLIHVPLVDSSHQYIQRLLWSEWFNSWFNPLFVSQSFYTSRLNGIWSCSLVTRVVCLLHELVSVVNDFERGSHICSPFPNREGIQQLAAFRTAGVLEVFWGLVCLY